MATSSPYRPRVSRETRLLLTAGLMAVAALWLLARIRFPERPVTPNPVPSVLSQLAGVPKYDDLAGEIAQLQARLQPSLLALDVPSAIGSLQTSSRTAAIRLRDDLAVTWVPPGSSRERWTDAPIVARDPASGLAVVRVPMPVSASPPVPWTPRQPQQPRYFVASDVSSSQQLITATSSKRSTAGRSPLDNIGTCPWLVSQWAKHSAFACAAAAKSATSPWCERPSGAAREPVAWSHLTSADEDRC
jgi:hypothetical protein